MPELSKLQIRAKVLAVISEIKMLQNKNMPALEKICRELDEIKDKKAMFDIFLKEYIKLKEEDYNFSACVLKNTVPREYLSEKSIEVLKTSSLTDEYKYKIVQLLRIAGGDYNYSELTEYFDNPQEVSDAETKRLLDSAVYNPEAVLDFLDFISAVSERDKSLLLESLNNDYEGDTLVNIIYPVLYSNFSSDFILQAVRVLADSKSSLAIAPFEYLIETSSSEEIRRTASSGLKKLKLAGASKEKAAEYFKNTVKNLESAVNYASIPDGSGRQAFLISKKHPDGRYALAAPVISDIDGIADCFGFFYLSEDELLRIIKRFYNSEGQYKVPDEYVTSRIAAAQKLNIINKMPFPYEFICWNPVISASDPMNISLEEYADLNCRRQLISKDLAAELLTEKYTMRWFFTPEDNKIIKRIIDAVYETENLDISKADEMIKAGADEIFNEETVNIWQNKFYNLIYILRHNQLENKADNFYTILKDETLFTAFKQIVMKRSIFSGFTAIKENTANSFLEKNIFKRRNTDEYKYDIKKLKSILNTLQKGWISG